MLMITLYKKDTKGKIRYLTISTRGPELVQESGILDTDSPITHKKVCKGKNIGRSNETTPEEQAKSEMDSKVRDKLTEGYFTSLEVCNYTTVILPMLAKDYKLEAHKIDWNSKSVYIQPKLDGMRCLAHIINGDVTLISRDGKVIENMGHIMDDLASIDDNIILDGELYAHGLSFQENMKLIKKYKMGETENIKFHVYDIVKDVPFKQRKVRQYIKGKNHLVEVSTYDVKNETELKKTHALFINEGYEGSIIRHGEDPYKVNGRSSSLLKYKDFIDLAIIIKDIEPADQRPEWGVPVFHWPGAKDDELRAGMKFSHHERKEFLINKANYIGKTAEIRFFEYSDEGVPRFPVMVGIRLDK